MEATGEPSFEPANLLRSKQSMEIRADRVGAPEAAAAPWVAARACGMIAVKADSAGQNGCVRPIKR